MGEEQWQHKQASFIRIYSQRGGGPGTCLGACIENYTLAVVYKTKTYKKNGANFFFWLKNTLTLTGTDTDESYKIAFVGWGSWYNFC